MIRARPQRARERREKSGLADSAYLEWCKRQKCSVFGCTAKRCDPHHHTNGRGLGQKSDDRRAFPLCRRHHDELHDFRGFFEGMSNLERRHWQTSALERARAAYEATTDRTSPSPSEF